MNEFDRNILRTMRLLLTTFTNSPGVKATDTGQDLLVRLMIALNRRTPEHPKQRLQLDEDRNATKWLMKNKQLFQAISVFITMYGGRAICLGCNRRVVLHVQVGYTNQGSITDCTDFRPEPLVKG